VDEEIGGGLIEDIGIGEISTIEIDDGDIH
jgi:hypothetical protein